VMQNRGSGPYGLHRVENLHVHHNTIVQMSGYSGLGQDVGDLTYFTGKNNRFTDNTYHLGANPWPFAWMNQSLAEGEWRRYGNDTTGLIVR
jgi:hypothetical protein